MSARPNIITNRGEKSTNGSKETGIARNEDRVPFDNYGPGGLSLVKYRPIIIFICIRALIKLQRAKVAFIRCIVRIEAPIVAPGSTVKLNRAIK